MSLLDAPPSHPPAGDVSEERVEKVFANLRPQFSPLITDNDIRTEIKRCGGHGGRARNCLNTAVPGSLVQFGVPIFGFPIGSRPAMMPGPPPVHTPYYRNYALSGPSRLSRGPPDFPEPEKPPIGAIPASTIANEEDVLKVLRPILMNEDPGGSVAEDNCSESVRGAFSVDGLDGRWGPMSVSMNPMCVPGHPMLESFIAACKRHQTYEVEIVFHGTADANIEPICLSGLDPKKRGMHGQAMGRGEYFARIPQIALNHARSVHGRVNRLDETFDAGRRLMIFAVLVDPATKGSRPDRQNVVVVEESDRQLPLAVLNIGSGNVQLSDQQSHDRAVNTAALKTAATKQAALAATMKAAEAKIDAATAASRAEEAKQCNGMWQSLICGDVNEFISKWCAACDANHGVPPAWAMAWASSNQQFLEAYKRDYPLLKTLDWGAHDSSTDPKRLRVESRQFGKFSENELEEVARRLSEDADQLSAKASSLEAAAATAVQDEAQIRKKNRSLSSSSAASTGAQSPWPPSAPPRSRAAVVVSPTVPTPTVPTPAATQRIMRELQQMRRADEADPSITVNVPDENNLYQWTAQLSLDEHSELGQDLHRYAAETQHAAKIELELTFNGGYPSLPPFVRVVSPRFAVRTGHVTVGGSICMEELTTSAWSPDMTVEGILQLVRAAFVTGGGRLDPRHADMPYHAGEAREAFARVARQHGWQ